MVDEAFEGRPIEGLACRVGAQGRAMATAADGDVWSGAQLAAQLVALNGVAPDPVQHVIFRSTRHADGALVEGYDIPGEPRMLDAAALDCWLTPRRLAGADRLAVAVLVIREALDDRGLVVQGTIERRRGAADGPYCGDPARVEFVGAAGAVRLYRSHLDGRLSEIAPSANTAPPRVRSPEPFAGERKALQARFGDAVRVLDAREPTLFEDMIGLSSIVHVRAADGRKVDCGIGWHGGMAFVLHADFPRFGSQFALAPGDAAAIDAALLVDGLVRGETRLDENGIAVVARHRGSEALVLLRLQSGQALAEPYIPGHDTGGPDQRRWMRCAETYEGLALLDAWRDGASDDLFVLTGDPSGQVWRHHIDTDGVETWRKADDDAAVGALHRERLFPGTLAALHAEPDHNQTAAVAPVRWPRNTQPAARDSLLVRAETYVHAMAALRAARDAVSRGASAVEMHLRALHAALLMLEAYVTAAAAQDVLMLVKGGTREAEVLARELEQLDVSLRRELAQNRPVIVAASLARSLRRDEPSFGTD